MTELFSDNNRYRTWRDIEIAAMRHHPDVPAEAVASAERFTTYQSLNNTWAEDVAKREAETGHDVVAFVRTMAGLHIAAKWTDWVHHGLTSSDLVDTGLAIQVNKALDLIVQHTHQWDAAMHRLHTTHIGTHRLGRTHGQAAAPTTFGHQIGYHRDAITRVMVQLDGHQRLRLTGKLSGPVGKHGPGTLTVDQEREALHELGLGRPNRVNSQVVMRDQLARIVSELAILASVVEGYALMIRLGAQSAIGELTEGQAKTRVGSSAMSHKENPVISEQLCGLARYIRCQVPVAMGNIALWDERDISNSSVERIIIPDIFNAVDHMLLTVTQLTTHLIVDENRMYENLRDAVGAGSFAGTQWMVVHGKTREEARDETRDWRWNDPDGDDL